jgi:nitrate reductase gamma subunit
MRALFSLLVVIALVVLALAGAQGGQEQLFGVVIPYVAAALFIGGFTWRVITWARSPVPFRIPTTGGQGFSQPWVKQNWIDNPSTTTGVVVRMFLEIFAFRSLFRNTRGELHDGRLVYGSDKWLWLAGLAFHYTFLVVLIRHLRFFTEPVPLMVQMIEHVDGFVQITVPSFLQTGAILATAAAYLLFRRLYYPTVRYISLPADYFPLFLILAIATSGMLMRYVIKTDLLAVKQLTMGLATLNPVVPKGIGSVFFVHIFLVSVLFAYFPFSKLMHMAGVWLSPTRNLANNSRMVRHINPWNYPVKVHTYAEYEDENREAMIAAGIPVEKMEKEKKVASA